VQLDQNALTQAQARVSSAEATLSSSQSIDMTLGQLASEETTKEQQLQDTLSGPQLDDLTSAADAVAADEARLTAALQQLFATTLVAPVAGQVTFVCGTAGELAGPNSTACSEASASGGSSGSVSGPSTVKGVGNGMPLVTIDAAPGLELIAQIPEQNITSVHVGEAASVTVDSGSSQVYQGKVTAIELVPVDVQGTVFYDVVVEPSGTPWPRDLLPGMTSNVSIPGA
jgi:HlyD family secretion protein